MGKHNFSSKHILKIESNSAMLRTNLPTNRIRCGIPQGSYLGPLLCSICMNDFERCLQGATPSLYADDTSITYSSTGSASLQRNIDIEMANVAE